jgi:hypothetical protein
MSKSIPKPTSTATAKEEKEAEVEVEVEGLESMITPKEADPMDELVSQMDDMNNRK